MPLIVEDGTGLANSESFISVADATTHHSAMGNTKWTGTATAQEQALRRATAVLDGYLWSGKRTSALQALSWPRTGALGIEGASVGTNVIPAAIKKACAELALRELVSPNSLNPDFVAGASVKREKVDVLEVEYSNPAQSASDLRPVVSVVATLVAPYLSSAGTSSALFGSSYRA